jgi:hypothetical protein
MPIKNARDNRLPQPPKPRLLLQSAQTVMQKRNASNACIAIQNREGSGNPLLR